MRVRAQVDNGQGLHAVVLATNGNAHALAVPPRASGAGSSANGGELLCLAVATCYCNDIYREAAARGIAVTRVEVEAEAQFGDVGAAARSLVYRASVTARAGEADIRELMLHTDRVAEVQATLRRGMAVRFEPGRAIAAT